MLPIITLFGQSGSGKSTVGKYLADTYGGKALAFADPMKEICKLQFGFNDNHLYGESEERNTPVEIKDWAMCNRQAQTKFYMLFDRCIPWYFRDPYKEWVEDCLKKSNSGGISPRDALKDLGEMAKTIDPQVWVRNTLNKAKKLLQEGSKFVVIADGRFLVEAIGVKEIGGTNVLIKRTDYESTTDFTHVSETSINNIPATYFDYKLLNTTSSNLKILYAAINRLTSKLRLDGQIPIV